MRFGLVRPLIVYFLATLICISWAGYAQEVGNREAVPPKMVFAHYMVCCPVVGTRPTITDFKSEILEAQERGIDGFALNCGSWIKKYPYYKKWALMLYEAAHQLGTNFKLFLSADRLDDEEMKDMIVSVYDQPNQFRFGGIPVFSTYGNPGDGKFLNDLRKIHKPVVWISHCFPQRTHLQRVYTPENADEVFNRASFADGFFYFGAAGTGSELSRNIVLLSQKAKLENKIFVAGVSPFYRGFGRNYRVFETEGFRGMAQQWETAIQQSVNWIEIVSWNDWSEAHYVAPFGPPEKTNFFWTKRWGPMLSHVAYLDASRYYIDWFKTGNRPSITEEKIFYFYRLFPKNLESKPDPTKERLERPKGADKLKDKVFVTTFLSAPATLTIYSGNTHQDFSMDAGVAHAEMTFALGKQRFVLKRSGKILVDKTGEQEISADDTSTNFNYFAGGSRVPSQ